jgi:hypothetical protein
MVNIKRSQKKSVYLFLTGGLGNQLFQYAAGSYLAEKQNLNLVADISTGSPRVDRMGTPEIFSFDLPLMDSINPIPFTTPLVSRICGYRLRRALNRKFMNRDSSNLLDFIFRDFWISISIRRFIKLFVSEELGNVPLPNYRKSTYLIGYFQTFYFAQYPRVYDSLMSLRLRNPNSEVAQYFALSELEKPLIVHVRLTDYLSEVSFGIPSTKYYSDSISRQWDLGIYKKIWVFSDDIEGARQKIPQDFHSNIRWISDADLDSASTLQVMRFGHGYVIANSSFSWWGAYLSYKTNIKIIAPKPWFSGKEEPKDLIPLEWSRYEAY